MDGGCEQSNESCPECYPNPPRMWWEQPMNDEVRAYAREYISPPKKFYPSLASAMAVWGVTITEEDRQCS